MAAPRTSTHTPAHPDRRDEVVQATWRVIARDGLDRASMRAIAHELGCTTGVLTHYFRDKRAMLDFAQSTMVESLEQGREPLVAGEPSVKSVIDHLCDVLPGNGRGAESWKVWISFLVGGFSRERALGVHAAYYRSLRAIWAGILRKLQSTGALRNDFDPDIEAATLLCLIDGLGIQGVISSQDFPPHRQRAVLEAHFAKLA